MYSHGYRPACIRCISFPLFHSEAVELLWVATVQGNKKGPVKRWDFDTEDAYSEYQSRREAMPK